MILGLVPDAALRVGAEPSGAGDTRKQANTVSMCIQQLHAGCYIASEHMLEEEPGPRLGCVGRDNTVC